MFKTTTSLIPGPVGSAMLGLVAGIAIAGAAAAQDQPQSSNRVATKTAWNVFVDENPRECWAVSVPEDVVNTRDGKAVAARRGDILLMVMFRPDSDVKGQVVFTSGYPFASGSSVNLNIGGTEFELATVPQDDPNTPGNDREWAWPASASEDAKIVTAMKRGASAVLTARSGRGTVTKDTFSLLGFTAAVEDAEKRCGS